MKKITTEAKLLLIGIPVAIWTLLPIYNMFLIALDPEEGEIEIRSIKCHGLADTHAAKMIAGMGVRDHQRWRKARANRRSSQVSGQQPKPLYGRLCAEGYRRDHIKWPMLPLKL